MSDKLTICDRCGSDACYVQEVTNEIKNYMCYGCGFVTNSVMKQNSEFLTEQMEFLPELYKELMGEDEDTGLVWMPNTINIQDKGMVFADGSSSSNWAWAAVKATPLQEGDKKLAENQTHKMDMDTLQHFAENDYIGALEYIGIFEA